MKSTQIEFILNQQTTLVEADSEDTILDSALKASLNAPYSCMNGMCMACSALIEEGEVDFPSDTALSDEDFDNGKILTCQARPKSGTLKLKINYDKV